MVESLLFEVTPVAIGSRRNPIFASFSDRGKLKQHSQAWSVLRRQSLLLRFHVNPIFCGRTGGQQERSRCSLREVRDGMAILSGEGDARKSLQWPPRRRKALMGRGGISAFASIATAACNRS
jgi:hypothetical protein